MEALILGLIFSLLFNLNTFAATPMIDGLSDSEIDELHEDFAANFIFASGSPLKRLGVIWGLEVGAVAGFTSSETVNKIHARLKSDSDYDSTKKEENYGIPHAAVLGRLSLGALLFEGTFFPEKTYSDVTYSHMGGALTYAFDQYKFNIGKYKGALDYGIRFHYTSSKLSYNQILNNYSTSDIEINSAISYDSNIRGADFIISSDFFFSIVTFYLGGGYAKSNGTLSTSNGSIFSETGSYASKTSATASKSGFRRIGGFNLNLWLLRIGVEGSTFLDTGKVSIKASLKI